MKVYETFRNGERIKAEVVWERGELELAVVASILDSKLELARKAAEEMEFVDFKGNRATGFSMLFKNSPESSNQGDDER